VNEKLLLYDQDTSADDYLKMIIELDFTMLKKKLKTGSVVVSKANDNEENLKKAALGLFEALTLKRPYDLLLCSLDNDDARLAVNKVSWADTIECSYSDFPKHSY
jgi:hypothetical protein